MAIIVIIPKGYWEPTIFQAPLSKVSHVVTYLILPINVRGSYHFHPPFTSERMVALTVNKQASKCDNWNLNSGMHDP